MVAPHFSDDELDVMWETMSEHIETGLAIADGEPFVFVWLNTWVPNGLSVQSAAMTPSQARMFAAELLAVADEAEAER